MIQRSAPVSLSLAALVGAFALGVVLALSGTRSGQAAGVQTIRFVEGFEESLNAVNTPMLPGWGRSNCASSEGEFSAWATALDADDQPIGCDGPFPEAVTSELILLLDLEEFSADLPVLDLRYDYRLETVDGDDGTASGLLFFNVIQQNDEIGDLERIAVYASHLDTQGRFEEVRLDLNALQNVYEPDSEPFSIAGQEAIIEWLYFARPVSGGVPAGAFIDNIRLEHGDAREPTPGPTERPSATATGIPTDPVPGASLTPTADSPPTVDSPTPQIYLPYLNQPEQLAVP